MESPSSGAQGLVTSGRTSHTSYVKMPESGLVEAIGQAILSVGHCEMGPTAVLSQGPARRPMPRITTYVGFMMDVTTRPEGLLFGTDGYLSL